MKSSQSIDIDYMDDDNQRNKTTDDFIKIIKELRKDIKESRKLQKKQLKSLREEKKKLTTKLKEEIKTNKYKNKELKKQLKEQKKNLQKQIQEHPKFKQEKAKREPYRYNVTIIIYGSYGEKELSDEEMQKKKEEFRRRNIKFFYKDTLQSDNQIEKRLYYQLYRPTSISIKLNKQELKQYNGKYTFNRQVFKHSMNVQSEHYNKKLFHNSYSAWIKLIKICKKDENFKECEEVRGSYIDAIYLYNANSTPEKRDETEPFQIIDVENYQALDNNAICYKHIDYGTNKNASNFKDLFQFEKANQYMTNVKANSCYFNLIIDTYKEALEKVYKNGERVYKDLTEDRLCKILGIENKNQDLGLSIRTSLKFFEKFHLGLLVVNIYDDVIFKYVPPHPSKIISPKTMYILVYNNHTFKLNSNFDSFVHKLNLKEVIDEDKETYENMKNKLSTKFYFRNFETEANKQYIEHINDTVTHIQNNTERKNINFFTNTDLVDILFQMIDNNYMPYVTMEKGILSRILFKLKYDDDDIEPVMYSVHHGDSSMVENEIMPIEENEVVSYDKADKTIYQWLLNRNNMSQRNDYIREIENTYQMAPLCGYFEGCDVQKTFNSIDGNKAYTSNLNDIKYFPVFNVFDIFLEYDGHTIEDYTQYIVQCYDNNEETSILFRKTYSRCYGYKLNRIENFNYSILKYRRPSKLNKSHSKQYVDDLYNCKISDDPSDDVTKKVYYYQEFGIN